MNQHDARRYAVFMDIVRPTPFPGFLSALVSGVAFAAMDWIEAKSHAVK